MGKIQNLSPREFRAATTVKRSFVLSVPSSSYSIRILGEGHPSFSNDVEGDTWSPEELKEEQNLKK